MTERFLNVGPGEHRAPKPWVNVDRRDIPTADIVAGSLPAAMTELEWHWGTVDRVYFGHVLEHVPWESVPDFLQQHRAVLKPGGLVAAVGPDLWKTLHRWRDGKVGPGLVEAVIEDDRAWKTGVESAPGVRHQWNCYGSRVVWALEMAGFVDVREVELTDYEALDDRWPVTAGTRGMDWQFAVVARKAD